MKRTLWIVALAIAVASIAGAQTTVVGTPHDLSVSTTSGGVHTNTNQVCVFCHTPHQASTAVGQAPLWNHELSSQEYTVYDSSSMDASATPIGGAAAGSATASHLCMSCHDGTVAVHSMWNPPNDVGSVTVTAGGNVDSEGMITGDPMIGTVLNDDHPINFIYDADLASTDGELVSPVSTSWVDGSHTVPLFNGSVQCASCHNAHKNPVGQQPFLVRNNDRSALCTTCHVK